MILQHQTQLAQSSIKGNGTSVLIRNPCNMVVIESVAVIAETVVCILKSSELFDSIVSSF